MSDASSDETERRIQELENKVAHLSSKMQIWCVRKRSRTYFFGLPLWEVAVGPDLEAGQRRGHAKAIIAIGDIATGLVAVGGVARGGLAIGGIALGLASVGGLAVGILCAGGGAIGLAAFGGGAIGFIAVGGGAVGYYALGDVAIGKYVVSTLHQDPEAVRFFGNWIPGLVQMFVPNQPPGGQADM